MTSYRQILYHIVFCTYNRENTISQDQEESLFRFIHGVIKKRKGFLYRINGHENHLHILSDLHPTIALADFIKEIKTASNSWMKETGKYPLFTSWAEGYCALTYTYRDKELIISYIKNQKEHHQKVTFEEEYRALLNEHGVVVDERYLF
jgi:REP element-mobilizing transposase RayT